MARTFTKDELNTRLIAADRKKEFGFAPIAEDEVYGKAATLVGEKAGAINAGIKSLDGVQMTPNDVLLGEGLCEITDGVPNLSGVLDPTAITMPYSTATINANLNDSGFVSYDSAAGGFATSISGGGIADTVASIVSLLTGLGSISDMGAKLTSGGGIPSIDGVMSAAKAGASSLAGDLTSSFTDLGASVGELADVSKISQVADFGNITDVVKGVSSVNSINSVAGLKDTVSNVTSIGALSEGVTSAKNSLDALDGAKDIVSTVKDATGTINNLVSQAENLKENVLEGVSSGLLGKGLLGDVFETVTREASQVLNSLTGGISIFSDAKKQTILQNVVSGNTRLFTQSVQEVSLSNVSVSPRAIELASQVEGSTTKELINKTSQVLKQNGIPDSEIATITDRYNSVGDTLLTDVINSTISGSVVVDPLFDEPDLIAKLNEKWSGANTSSDLFTYIASVEELETEFTLIRREITEVVLHATDTFTNKNVGSVEINEIHNQLGHDGIGYHYIIRRDGRLQRGRPPNKVGEHTSTNNHNTRSLGVALVGGINASSGVKNPSELRSAQSFTREQFTTLEKFLSIYYQKYPGGQVFGHNDLDISEFDPYFDVPDYVEAVFRKKNVTTDPLNTEPLKSSEIV